MYVRSLAYKKLQLRLKEVGTYLYYLLLKAILTSRKLCFLPNDIGYWSSESMATHFCKNHQRQVFKKYVRGYRIS